MWWTRPRHLLGSLAFLLSNNSFSRLPTTTSPLVKHYLRYYSVASMKGIQIEAVGNPEVMQFKDLPDITPNADEVLISNKAIGVNYIDTYHRTGLYKLPLPFTPGREAAGDVVAVGCDVSGVTVGDRVTYTAALSGSYATHTTVKAAQVIPVPEGVSYVDAAASMLQGMTAHYLACSTFPLSESHTCLIHAAAGGTGQLLTQIAKLRGAKVIATCSTPEKVEIAKAAGADHVINYATSNFQEEVMKLTENKGVDVVYDSVGKSTWEGSLKSLRPRGMLVLFGNASGPVPPFDPLLLSANGSLFVTRPTLNHYTLTREEMLQRSGDILKWIKEGNLKVSVAKQFPLAEASKAHEFLEARKALGKVMMTV